MTATTPPVPPVQPAPLRDTKTDGKPRGRVWIYRVLLVLGCGLLAAAWFAPIIVAKTALRQQLAKLLLPRYPGAIEIGSASCDWLSPVVIQNLRAEDAEGHPILEVGEFSTSEPLWRLVTRPGNLGRLKLNKPHVSLSFRSGGSNLEDLLEKLAGDSKQRRPPDFELEVLDATIALEHKLDSLRTTLQPVSVILSSTRGIVDELEFTVGQVPSPGEPSSTPTTDWLAFRIGSQPTQDGVAMTPGSKHLRLKAQGWKLDKLLPALLRFEPKAELAGEIDADARSQIDRMDAAANWMECEWSWDGRVTAKNLRIGGLSLLKQDRFNSESILLAGRIAVQRSRLSMDRLQFKTEVGDLNATGDIPLMAIPTSSASAAGSSILEEQDYQIEGHLDLQKLAALLPNTLSIRKGTQITGGRLGVKLLSEDKDKTSRHWTAGATIDGLAGTNNGRAVSWTVPLQITVQAHRAQKVVTVDQVTCKSDFLNVTGGGTLTDAHFEANGDLSRLEASLQQLFDFGLQKLAGRMHANGRIQRTVENQISLVSIVQLDNFDWSSSNKDIWQEPHLILKIQAAGQTEDNARLKQIDSAELKLVSGTDSLTTLLTQPVDLEAAATTWPLKASLMGDLRTWQNRCRPLLGPTNWQSGGQVTFEAAVNRSPQQMEITKISGTITSLELKSPEWWIKEPKLTVDAAATWNVDRRELSSPQVTISATSLSCRVDSLLMALKSDGSLDRVTGETAFRADLDKMTRWKIPAAYYAAGILEGKGSLSEHDSVFSFDTDATITNFVVKDLETLPNQQLQWVAWWREPQLQLFGKGSYDTSSDSLTVETASMHGDGLGVSMKGSMSQLRSAQRVDIRGQLDYDWDLASKRLGESFRKSIQLSGKESRPFQLTGTLASLNSASAAGAVQPPDLAGQAGIGWQSAVFQNLTVGPAELVARLDQGVCQFTPIDTTLADGRLHLTPQLRFDRNPAVLVLPAEKVLNEVQLTPQLCASWIKFVAPMLADATQVNGKCSMELAGGTLPLSAPKTGELSGALTVHQVQVRPGNSANQIVNLISQIQSVLQRGAAGNAPADQVWVEMPEQQINFKLANGRVTNDGVTFNVRGATIKSSGSVGLIDETLDIVLQLPIQDSWLPDKKLLQGLKGQSLQIPVRGTLSQPQIDGRVIADLASKMGGAAINGVIDGTVDDLFKKKFNKFLPGQD